ncbi:hypothetical protein GF356_10835 [candidate division GN15 bacterium]|nr:hypothetical protein [candidate division GN15 bacterium]
MHYPYASRTVLLPALILLVWAAAVWAVPNQISYQGRLLDASDQPVSDATYQLGFSIYSDSTGTTLLWSESAQVTTANGLFTHQLGSVQNLPDSLFASFPRLFLELTIAGETTGERVLLAATPYSRAAGGLRVNNDSDSLAIQTFSNSHQLSIYDTTGLQVVKLQGAAYGELSLSVDTSVTISLNAGLVDDSSVMLPDNAINAEEMFNEPGVSVYTNSSFTTLATGGMTDLIVLEMTVPEEGYIVLHGKCYAILSGTTGPNSAIIQIDQQSGGGTDFPYFSQVGLGGYVNTEPNYFPVYVTRSYFVEPGTYEFRMEGRAQDPLPAVAQSWDHVLTAVYYPTAYWAVKATTLQPGDFENAVPIMSDDPHNQGRQPVKYEVDLRELERRSSEK